MSKEAPMIARILDALIPVRRARRRAIRHRLAVYCRGWVA
jgi:hypothetical protein